MSETAAARIVLDDEVLARQVAVLSSASAAIGGLSAAAGRGFGGSAFGVTNAFLVGPLNGIARKSAEFIDESAAMAERMSEAVAAARRAFAELEASLGSALDASEVGLGLAIGDAA